jgi:hypothetical protein
MPQPSFSHARLARLSLVALGCCLLLTGATPARAPVCGDVDASESVTAGDALRVLKKAVGADIELICSGECSPLEARVDSLETALAETQADLADAQALLLAATDALDDVTALLAGVTRSEDAITFSGVNVQVVDGTDGTGGATNGLGNLIIGYNENTQGRARTGSHNLVVGREHEYTSFGGIVAGYNNTLTATEGSVLGGRLNKASGLNATVLGGNTNFASGAYTAVVGGNSNEATGTYSAIGGGFDNSTLGQYSAIAGGCENTTGNSSTYSAISGGQLNQANALWSSVAGGFTNKANGQHSSVSGGSTRTSVGQYDWRAGALFEEQ